MKTNIIIHALWKNKYTILQYLNLYNKDKEVSRKEWTKIVGLELPGYFESIYENWLNPKNRKKISNVKI